jgi:hypothetical protein
VNKIYKKYRNKNTGTKVKKTGTKSRNKNFKKPGTKITKI